jgi:dTDP-4-amino-4,6-dideoxygalactose transaminase
VNTPKVPFLDLRQASVELRDELDLAYRTVMDSGRYLLGDELQRFESSFAESSGSKYCVGVASGLDALALTFKALGIGQGDEVIVPSHTFIATWLAVSAVGATLVPIDPDPKTCCITADCVAGVITERTACVVPVHLYGLPCDMQEIESVARTLDIPVIADAAQSHGATLRGAPIGAFGQASAWSFYPGKNLGAFADAGAVTTDSEDLARRLRSLRNYGSEKKYVHNEQGSNSRLDELQAAFLSVKLRRLADWNARRQSVAQRYLTGLSDLPISLPAVRGDRTSSWHLFVVQTDDRDQLQQHLAKGGVETLIHYPVPCHRQGAYNHMFPDLSVFPIADKLAASILSLPIGPHMSDEAVEYTISTIKAFF